MLHSYYLSEVEGWRTGAGWEEWDLPQVCNQKAHLFFFLILLSI